MIVTTKLLVLCLLLFELVMLVIVGIFFKIESNSTVSSSTALTYYNFRDGLFFVLVGFTLFLSYLRLYSWSSLSYPMIAVALVFQYYLMWGYFWKKVANNGFATQTISISIQDLCKCVYASFSVLISYAAVLGRIGVFEIVVIIIIHIIGYSCNQMLLYNSKFIDMMDIGQGMGIHLYGGFFGLMLASLLPKAGLYNHQKRQAGYFNSMLALVGTLILWTYWPGFLCLIKQPTGLTLTKVVVNTVFSLIGTTVATFATSIYYRGKLGINQIQRGVITGGVMASICADLNEYPIVYLLDACFVGWITTSACIYLSPYLEIKKIYDSYGVVNIHILPAIWGSFLSSILIASSNNTQNLVVPTGRDFFQQGGWQMAGFACSIGFGLLFGLLCGAVLRKLSVYQKSELYNDETFWEIPEGEQQSTKTQKYQIQVSNKMDFSQKIAASYKFDHTPRYDDLISRSPLRL